GALAAAAVLGRQDVGAAAAAALGTALVFHPPAARARSVGAFAAGFALVLGSAALAIWWSGFALDLVRETILAPLWGVVHFSYLGRPALWPLWRQDAALRENAFSYFPPVLFDRYWPAISESALYRKTALIDAALKLVYHLPWIVLLLGALVTLARWRRGAGGDLASRRRLLLLLLACAFLAAFNGPHDWVHLLVLYPPPLLLAADVACPLLRRPAAPSPGAPTRSWSTARPSSRTSRAFGSTRRRSPDFSLTASPSPAPSAVARGASPFSSSARRHPRPAGRSLDRPSPRRG